LNFWTGGSQLACKGEWAWCSGSAASPIADNLTWAFNQPDNKLGADDCLHMRIFQNKTGIALSDRNCSDKFVIACEVEFLFKNITGLLLNNITGTLKSLNFDLGLDLLG